MTKTFKKLSVVKKTPDFRKAVRMVSVPLLPPQEDQVLIKVIYAGVNATDINITAGSYPDNYPGTEIPSQLPFDIGIEALGVIEVVGKGVTTFKVGQPIIFVGRPRAYSEYMYAKPKELIPVPEVKPEFLALMVSGLTATISLDEMGRIKAGDNVLITASAGGTGIQVIQRE